LRVVAGAVAEEHPNPHPRRGFARRTERVANAHGNIHWLPVFFKGMVKNSSLLTNHERNYNPDFERRSRCHVK
jgi:hypothetical protein